MGACGYHAPYHNNSNKGSALGSVPLRGAMSAGRGDAPRATVARGEAGGILRLGRQSAIGIAFAGLLLALLWGAVAARLHLESRTAVEVAARQNAKLARVFEAHARRTLSGAEALLTQAEVEYQRRGRSADLQRLLGPAGRVDAYPVLAVLDAEGQLAASSRPLPRTDFSGLPVFRTQVSSPDHGLQIGPPGAGDLLDTCTFLLSRRIERTDGRLAGVVLVAIDAEYFSRLYDAVEPEPLASIALVADDGTVVAQGTTAAPRIAATPASWRPPQHRGADTFRIVDERLGTGRHYAFHRVKDYPLTVLVGISDDIAFADYRRTRADYLAWSACLSALIILFVLLTLQQGQREARAGRVLRHTAERLAEAQRLAQIGNWELDLRDSALHWSSEIFRLFELDEASFSPTYRAFLERVHPEDRAMVDQVYRDSVVTRRPYAIEHRLLMPDGRVKHVHEECLTEYDERNRPLRSVGTVQDITDRKQAEEARARLAALVQSANDAIVSRTLDGIVTSWNAGAERLFGYRAHEIVGRSYNRVRTTTDPARMQQNTARIGRGEYVEPFETLRRHKDGTLIPVLINISPIRDESGRVIEASLIMRDLRGEKAAQAQLALAASVFEHASEGILVTDVDNRIVSVNRAFTRITGYTREEVLGRNPRLLSSNTHDGAFYREMWRTLHEQGVWQGEVWDRRKSDELYCQSLSIAVIRDASGEIRNYCAVFMDITRRKRAEEALIKLNTGLEARVETRTRELEASNQRLRDANDELNAFSYSVSHDLRAPLRRIDGYATLALQAGSGDPERMRNWLERIQSNVRGMSALVEDLLRLSMVTRRDLVPEEFDLSRAAADVVASLREEHQEDSRCIAVTIEPALRVCADRALVRILLENLLGNAWKFTRRVAQTRITVGSCETLEGRAYFVQDNGAGFDLRRAEQLFRPFTRLHGADEYEGTGIGLSIVQRIAHRHGGRVWAEAEEGRGATFYFTLDSHAGATT